MQKAVNNRGRGKGRGTRGGRGRGRKIGSGGGKRNEKSESEEPLSSTPSVIDDDTPDETEKEKEKEDENKKIQQTARRGKPFCVSGVTRKRIQKCSVSLDNKDAELKLEHGTKEDNEQPKKRRT